MSGLKQRNPSWSTDEVFLGIDLLLNNDIHDLQATSSIIAELSSLLNSLPIIPNEKRAPSFRNQVGVSQQLLRLHKSITSGNKSLHIGNNFLEIYNKYEKQPEALHKICQAIKRNQPFYKEIGFGAKEEEQEFPEGALLGHLHRFLENRDKPEEKMIGECQVCSIQLSDIYGTDMELEAHLVVLPVDLDARRRYSNRDFIWVCPNCHAALHRIRPWRVKNNAAEILI